VALQSFPGLVVLYGGIMKEKWAVNSAFMALYAFAAVWICWVTWAYNMSFGDKLLPLWGKARPALLIGPASLPATAHYRADGTTLETGAVTPAYPMATVVYFQCVFAAITLVLLAWHFICRETILMRSGP
jgi:ammonium transporter, Amt family